MEGDKRLDTMAAASTTCRSITHEYILLGVYMLLWLIAAIEPVSRSTWLLENIPLFILFWTCVVVGLVQILMNVCKGCENRKCVMRTFRN